VTDGPPICLIVGQRWVRSGSCCWIVLGRGSLRDHLLDDLPIRELLPHFDDRLGRPSKDLHIVIGLLLLQQLHDLSDAATVVALAFNMAWHHALDVRVEADCYFCEKTLRNYRGLFIAEGLDEVLFRRMTDRLLRAFSVDTSRQRMESTALRSAMCSLARPYFNKSGDRR
jgi:hypothetical protein